jgi:hypothetical protein
MARRRKSVKRSPRRRSRKMGAISKSGLMDLAYQVAGGIAATVVSKAIKTSLGKMSSPMDESTQDLISNAVPVVVGFVLPQKSAFTKGLATGMKIAGASKLVASASGLAGVGAMMFPLQRPPMVGAIDERSSLENNPPPVAGFYAGGY